jgi:hypothetical protein
MMMMCDEVDEMLYIDIWGKKSSLGMPRIRSISTSNKPNNPYNYSDYSYVVRPNESHQVSLLSNLHFYKNLEEYDNDNSSQADVLIS